MTKEHKNLIVDLRKKGYGYATIAKATALSINTIKSFCRRNGLAGAYANFSVPVCDYCGEALEQLPKAKPKRFCSECCRRAGWKVHPEERSRRAYYQKVCAYCGKPYTTYGRQKSKFCCLDCSHNARKGEVRACCGISRMQS